MLTFLQNTVSGWSKVAGVELTLLPEGFVLNVCLLEKKKGTIQLQKQQSGLASLEELKAFLAEELPVALTLSGRGVLHKKVDNTSENDKSKLLLQVVPNAKASDFYLQLASSGPHVFLSLVRKPTLQEVLDQFKAIQLEVVSVSFGALVLQSLLPLLPDVSALQVGEHNLEIRKGEVSKYSYGVFSEASLQTPLVLGKESIAGPMAVAYASAFQLYLPEPLSADSVEIGEAREEYIQKQLFTKLGWGVLIFFMVVLLGNYLVFSQLSKETDNLSMAASLQKSQLDQLSSLSKEVSEKEKFFKGAGWLEDSKASFYADRIAATIPESVLLNSLSLNPLDEKISRDERKQVFQDGLIVLTGTCKRPIDLNGWIKRLKDFRWAKKVNVENYNYDSGEKTGNFKVEIQF